MCQELISQKTKHGKFFYIKLTWSKVDDVFQTSLEMFLSRVLSF